MCVDRSIISDVKELEIVGSHLGPYVYSSTMQLLSEKSVKTEKMVTHDLPLSDWRKDIHTSTEWIDNAMRVIMTP